MINLRSGVQRGLSQGGYGLAAFESPTTDPDAIQLGNDLKGSLRLPTRRTLATELGLASRALDSADSITNAIWDLLTLHSDPTGQDSWGSLMPTSKGRFELHLAGEIKAERFQMGVTPGHENVLVVLQNNYRQTRADVLARKQVAIDLGLDPSLITDIHLQLLSRWERQYRVPYRTFIPNDLPDEGKLPRSTIFTDIFNRPNEDLQVSPNWNAIDGNDIGIVSEEVKLNTVISITNAVEWAFDLDGDDNSAQVDVLALNPSIALWSVMCRMPGGAVTGYGFRRVDVAGEEHQLEEITAGVTTVIAGPTSEVFSFPEEIYVEADGTTIKGTIDGVEKHSVTDVVLAIGKRCGFRAFKNNGGADVRLDNYVAMDLGLPPDPPIQVLNVPLFGQTIYNSADEENRPRYAQRIARGTEE